MKPKKPTLDRRTVDAGNVVLCRTFNRRAGRRLCDTLIMNSIAFTQIWKRVPFFLREYYHGKDEFCVISINRNEYAAARRAIDSLDDMYKRRLTVNML